MFEQMVSFFKGVGSTGDRGKPGVESAQVAAAALLYHVMDSDGIRRIEEKEKLAETLAELFGLGTKELQEVLNAGEEADRQAIDLYSFTRVLLRALDEQQRLEFIEIMWEVVYADGVLHELEDNTVWRVAELLGISDRERVLLRSKIADRHEIRDGADNNGES